MEVGNKGAYNEITAIGWLLKNNYSVFRNVSAHGPIDLIAVKGNEFLKLDVKAGVLYKGKQLQSYLTKEQIALGVKAITVFSDGSCRLDTDAVASKRHALPFEQTCFRCGVTYKSPRQRQFCTAKCRSAHHNAAIRAKRATNGP